MLMGVFIVDINGLTSSGVSSVQQQSTTSLSAQRAESLAEATSSEVATKSYSPEQVAEQKAGNPITGVTNAISNPSAVNEIASKNAEEETNAEDVAFQTREALSTQPYPINSTSESTLNIIT